jgi:hypothetical protein
MISIPISRILRKISFRLWHMVRPRHVKGEPYSAGARFVDVLSYAVIAAAASVLARVLTRKAAEKSFEKLMGTPPPPEEVAW